MASRFATRWPSQSDRRREETGFTLIEVLVALVILSIGVVALMGGFGLAVFGSGLNRNQADADAALVMAVENLKTLPYQVCSGSTAPTYSATPVAGSPYFSAQYSTWPTNPVSPVGGQGYFVVSVQAWNGTAFYTVSGQTPCPPVDFVQQVTVEAVSPDHKASQQVTVQKGRWS